MRRKLFFTSPERTPHDCDAPTEVLFGGAISSLVVGFVVVLPSMDNITSYHGIVSERAGEDGVWLTWDELIMTFTDFLEVELLYTL